MKFETNHLGTFATHTDSDGETFMALSAPEGDFAVTTGGEDCVDLDADARRALAAFLLDGLPYDDGLTFANPGDPARSLDADLDRHCDCFAVSPKGYSCTRDAGHVGQHVAEGMDAVISVWTGSGADERVLK